jgi:hypothetical protein
LVSPAGGAARLRTLVSTGLTEIAFTATRISRPFGSGFASSKSISEFASSIGSDCRYPTAFMCRFSLAQ